MRQTIHFINQFLTSLGGQIVSAPAGRFVEITRYVQRRNGAINLLELVVQNEIHRLKGYSFNIIQIGANDGMRFDPYRELIEKYHFCGVLVEPNVVAFHKLVESYKKQTQLLFENIAIGKKNGRMPFYMLEMPDGQTRDLDVYSSLDIRSVKHFQQLLKRKRLKIKEINIPVMSYETLLSKYNINYVSLLAIDTEGYDFEIIKSINFDKNRPRIIEYEHSHLSIRDEKECASLLMDKGYTLYRSFGDDTICILND